MTLGHLTSLKVSEEDKKFCQEQGIPFSQAFREGVQARRVVQGGHIVENVAIERERKEKFIELSEKLMGFIESKGLMDEWLKQEGFK